MEFEICGWEWGLLREIICVNGNGVCILYMIYKWCLHNTFWYISYELVESSQSNFEFMPEDIKSKQRCKEYLTKSKNIIKFKNIIANDIYYIE